MAGNFNSGIYTFWTALRHYCVLNNLRPVLWALCKCRELKSFLLCCCMLSESSISWAVNFWGFYVLFNHAEWSPATRILKCRTFLGWWSLCHTLFTVCLTVGYISLLGIPLKLLDKQFPAFRQDPSSPLVLLPDEKDLVGKTLWNLIENDT